MFICEKCKLTFKDKIDHCPECGGEVAELAEDEIFFEGDSFAEDGSSLWDGPGQRFDFESDFSSKHGPGDFGDIDETAKKDAHDKATAATGLVFGILGLLMSVCHLLYVLSVSYIIIYRFKETIQFAGILFAAALFMIPCSIVGIVMSCKPVSKYKKVATAGKIISIISIGLFVLSILLAFMFLIFNQV